MSGHTSRSLRNGSGSRKLRYVLNLLSRSRRLVAPGEFRFEFLRTSQTRERENEKLTQSSQRNQGVNSTAMIGIARTSQTSRSYGHASADLRRCSDSSSLNSMDHHHGQMSPPTAYADPSVSPEHGVYPTTQHGLLNLGAVHSPQPIVRDYQISLPPVSELLHFKETVKDSLRTAQIHLDSGDLVAAGDHLEYGLKTLHWLTSKGCR